MEIDLGLDILNLCARVGGPMSILKVYQGESRKIALGIYEAGSPFPIPEDAQVMVAVKKHEEDIFYSFTVPDEGITRYDPPGVISFTPTAAQTNLYPGPYVLQVSITRGSEVIKTVVGELEILPSVIPYGTVGVGAALLPALEAEGNA